MTSRGPGRASRTPEMEEKEQLRRQIRLLQGGSGRAGPRSRVVLFPGTSRRAPAGLPEEGRPPPAVSTARPGWVGRAAGDLEGHPGRPGQPLARASPDD